MCYFCVYVLQRYLDKRGQQLFPKWNIAFRNSSL